MRHLLQAVALTALSFGACSGYVAWGYAPCDPYYYPYCYDYYYATWDPTSVAATDFDADGRLDFAVSDGQDGSLWFLSGQAGGGFGAVPTTNLTLPASGAAVAAVDADGDDRPDLLVLDGSSGSLTTYAGDGHGGFAPLGTTQLTAGPLLGVVRLAHGRLDGDVLDDVVMLDELGGLHVALGTGTGSFSDVGPGDPATAFLGPDVALRLAGIQVALAEFDGQPGLDLIVLDGERATLALFPGNGDGTFDAERTVTFASSGDVLSVAPVTSGAGLPAHLAVLSGSRSDPAVPSTVAVLRLSDGAFEVAPLLVGAARMLVPLDLDGDGLTDLLLVDTLGRTIRTLRARR